MSTQLLSTKRLVYRSGVDGPIFYDAVSGVVYDDPGLGKMLYWDVEDGEEIELHTYRETVNGRVTRYEEVIPQRRRNNADQ